VLGRDPVEVTADPTACVVVDTARADGSRVRGG
jgi:hypothetical protein